jgi:hypothetical protein
MLKRLSAKTAGSGTKSDPGRLTIDPCEGTVDFAAKVFRSTRMIRSGWSFDWGVLVGSTGWFFQAGLTSGWFDLRLV